VGSAPGVCSGGGVVVKGETEMRVQTIVGLAAGALLGATSGAMAQGQGSISTTFEAGNGQAGAMFDIRNIGTLPIRITGFDYRLSTTSAVTGEHEIEVYHTPSTFVGKETDPGPWTLMGTAITQLVAGPTPIHAPIGGLLINPGESYGIYFTRNSTLSTQSIAYTNGQNQYTNNEVQLDAGVGKSYPFGSTFSPRTWNGTVYYDIIPTPGTLALLGMGGLLAARRRR
jgi:hypothetical protein